MLLANINCKVVKCFQLVSPENFSKNILSKVMVLLNNAF